MSLRILLAIAVSLVCTSAAPAQRPRFVETAEPPLADGSNAPISQVRFVDSPAPVVQLSVRAPAMHAAGNPVPVKLIVENAARSPAQNVTIFYPLPAGASVANAVPESTPVQGGCTWKFETLPAAGRKEIAFMVLPAADTGELTHKARITFDFEQTAPATHFAKAEIKLRKIGPDQALKHDILVFAIDVTNTGVADLNDVRLVDALPEGLEHRPDDPSAANQPLATKPPSEITADKRTRTFKIGRLPAGQTRRVEYYVMAVGAVGPIAHQATALAVGIAEPAKAESRVTLAEPKLELTADATPRRPATQSANVRIKLTNRSLRALSNIVVSDRAGPGAQFESASAGGQTFDGRVQWIVPLLAANETRILEATIRCTTGGRVAHQVSAVYRGLSQGTEAFTEFEANAALQTEFRGTSHAVELNGEVQYTLTIRNVGSAPAVNVRPTIGLPAELKLVKSSPNAASDGGRTAFDAATVPPGGKLVCTVTAKAVQTAVDARVMGEVAADLFTSGPVRKQEPVTIGGNDLAVPVTPQAQPALPKPAPPPKQ